MKIDRENVKILTGLWFRLISIVGVFKYWTWYCENYSQFEGGNNPFGLAILGLILTGISIAILYNENK